MRMGMGVENCMVVETFKGIEIWRKRGGSGWRSLLVIEGCLWCGK